MTEHIIFSNTAIILIFGLNVIEEVKRVKYKPLLSSILFHALKSYSGIFI